MKVILKVYLLSHIAFLSHGAEQLFLEKTSSLTSSASAARTHCQLSQNLIALIARIKSDNRDRSVIEKELAENPDPNYIFSSDESKKKFLTYSFTSEDLTLLSKSAQFKEYYSKHRLPLTVALFHSTVSEEEAPEALYFSSNDTFWTSHGTQIKKWNMSSPRICKEESKTQLKGIKKNTFLVNPEGSQFLIIENETELSMVTPTIPAAHHEKRVLVKKEVPGRFVGCSYLTGKKIRSCSFITENIVCITYEDDSTQLWDPKQGTCSITSESSPTDETENTFVVGISAANNSVKIFKKILTEKSLPVLFQKDATIISTLHTSQKTDTITKAVFNQDSLTVTALTDNAKLYVWRLDKKFSAQTVSEFLLSRFCPTIAQKGIKKLHPTGARIALEAAQGCMKNQLICVYEIPSRTHLYNIPIVSSAPITKFVFGSTANYCATLDAKKRVKVWHTPEKLDALQYLIDQTKKPAESFDLNDLHDFHKRGYEALEEFKKRPAPSTIASSLTVRL